MKRLNTTCQDRKFSMLTCSQGFVETRNSFDFSKSASSFFSVFSFYLSSWSILFIMLFSLLLNWPLSRTSVDWNLRESIRGATFSCDCVL